VTSQLTATLAFVPIARPTFDVLLAESLTSQTRRHLEQAGLKVIGPDALVMNLDDMHASLEQLQANAPDLLLVLQASFADSTMVLKLAQGVDAPLLLWALPEERVGGRLRLNSFCGINLAAHGLRRAGIPYDYVYEAPDSRAAIQKVQALTKAAAVKKRLQGARIGRIGENPDGFDTCLVNETGLKATMGLDIVQIDLQQLFAQARQADAAKVIQVESRVRDELAGYDAVNAEEARGTLRTFVTLDDVASAQKLDGLAMRCWPEIFSELGCSACGAMSMMSNQMTPCSCEADVNGTITQLILQWISGEPAFGSDVVSFDVDEDLAILWHCGLAPLAMADPDSVPEAALHSNRQKPLLLQFPLKPGRVTLARLSEATGSFRLVVGGGEMLKAPPAFTGTSGTLRFDSGAAKVMDTIMQEGLEHHLSLTYGDHTQTLTALARMLDLDVLHL